MVRMGLRSLRASLFFLSGKKKRKSQLAMYPELLLGLHWMPHPGSLVSGLVVGCWFLDFILVRPAVQVRPAAQPLGARTNQPPSSLHLLYPRTNDKRSPRHSPMLPGYPRLSRHASPVVSFGFSGKLAAPSTDPYTMSSLPHWSWMLAASQMVSLLASSEVSPAQTPLWCLPDRQSRPKRVMPRRFYHVLFGPPAHLSNFLP